MGLINERGEGICGHEFGRMLGFDMSAEVFKLGGGLSIDSGVGGQERTEKEHFTRQIGLWEHWKPPVESRGEAAENVSSV